MYAGELKNAGVTFRPAGRPRGVLLAALALAGLVRVAGLAMAAEPAVTAPPPAAPRALRRELDRAEALLRERLSALPDGSGVVVHREADHVTLAIPARLLFGADSSALKKDALLSVPLSAALRLLKKRRNLSVDIDVYTDSLGGVAANQSFSEQRALALRSALRAAGIAEERLRPHGEGPAAPLASNDTPQGRIENRRVEIVFRRELLPPARAARVTPAPATAP